MEALFNAFVDFITEFFTALAEFLSAKNIFLTGQED